MTGGAEMSKAAVGIQNRLRETTDELDLIERRRARLLASRRLLSLKLVGLGLSERAAAALARVSGPAVHQWGKR